MGLPRMRGDRPCSTRTCLRDYRFTPHARGSTPKKYQYPPTNVVYPACAGIDLGAAPSDAAIPSLPRMRGDRPPTVLTSVCQHPFTPHARGSTSPEVFPWMSSLVYPACAGIDPSRHQVGRKCERLPRMRGDRPKHAAPWWRAPGFTPHARGSTTQ